MLRLAGVVLLCLAASGCTDVIAATSGPACGPKMAAVKTTYEALEKSDVVGSAMGMARSMRDLNELNEDGPRARRRAREMQRAGRAHARNMGALQRATTAYTAASKVCWFVPPPPVGMARAISFH